MVPIITTACTLKTFNATGFVKYKPILGVYLKIGDAKQVTANLPLL